MPLSVVLVLRGLGRIGGVGGVYVEKMESLLRQQSLRQVEIDRQVLQALRQASAALQQAQQVLLSDMKLHENLSQSGDYSELLDAGLQGPLPGQNEGQIPPWLLARPPELQ